MTTISLPELQSQVRGRVIGPADEGYDGARTIMLGGADPRPAVIVRPVDDADVASAIALAREAGLPLAVRSGGHSGAGHSTADGGLVIDLRDMTAIDIDVAGRTAWAEAGLTAAEFTTATAEHGLAVGFGDTGSVGLGGLTLGGGVGYLARKHGLTIDHLIAADVVTADRRGAAGRRAVAPRPVLGDPRRRRQLRRRHPVPVPAAGGRPGRRRPAGPARDGRDRGGIHRGGRGGARGHDDDRQRHELPADAVPPRGAARQPGDPGHHVLER